MHQPCEHHLREHNHHWCIGCQKIVTSSIIQQQTQEIAQLQQALVKAQAAKEVTHFTS